MYSIGQELTSRQLKDAESKYSKYLISNQKVPKKLLLTSPSISNKGKHKITNISDTDYLNLLFAESSASSRSELSRFGKSHDKRVTISDLQVHLGFTGEVLNPKLILFQGGEIINEVSPSENLFIVENKELFYAETFLRNEVLSTYKSVDVAFGKGKYIQNSQFSEFLKSYNRIIYFPDFDLEGLRIAHAMKCMYNCDIFIPRSIEKKFKESEFYVKNNKELNDLINISILLSVPLAKLFRAYRTKIEQEMFLI